MNLGIQKKVIFSYFLFVNFIQPTESAEFRKLKKVENYKNNLIWSKILNNKTSSNTSKSSNFKLVPKVENSLDENLEPIVALLSEQEDNLVIQSDKQSEIDNVLHAKGNVSVSYRGKLHKADTLIYDKSNKKISAEGNIILVFGEQIFRMSKLEYNFNDERGYLLDVKGSINSDKLIADISKNFYDSDFQTLNDLLNLRKKL